MKVEFESDWLNTQIELMKTLRGYELVDVNKEIGCVDFSTNENNDGRKLLRVMVDSSFNASTGDLKSVEKTLEILKGEEYNKAVMVAESFTQASKALIRKKQSLELVTQGSEHYSMTDLQDAIYSKTQELCETKCGKFPTSSDDCKGLWDGRYVCAVGRVSDDSDFHAERGWVSLLLSDFHNLIELEREIKG